MNYLPLSKFEDKQHILALVDFIYHNVIEEGGDGDAIWYSIYYDVKDIKLLIEEFNSKLKFPWKVKTEGNSIQWGEDQEWVIITNDKNIYDNNSTRVMLKISL
jgi:hypothetical protein